MAKMRIVFVDDEKINLLAFRAQFRREYEVECTSDPDEFLSLIDSETVQCVFSDQRMPHITGTELIARAKQKRPDIHAAIITGYPEDSAIQDALHRGVVNAVFEKPYSTHAIIEFVEHSLGDAFGSME